MVAMTGKRVCMNTEMCMFSTTINKLGRPVTYVEILVKIQINLAEILSFWTQTEGLQPNT